MRLPVPGAWLDAHVDGELRGWRALWLRLALASSPSLRGEVAGIRALSSLLHSKLDPPPDPDLWPELVTRLQGPRQPASGSRRRLAVQGSWGAALAASALGLAVWISLPEVTTEGPGGASRVRSLDTGGHGVWVEESERATIIWLVDPPAPGS